MARKCGFDDCLIKIDGEWFRMDGIDEDDNRKIWLEKITFSTPIDLEFTEDLREFSVKDLRQRFTDFYRSVGPGYL